MTQTESARPDLQREVPGVFTVQHIGWNQNGVRMFGYIFFAETPTSAAPLSTLLNVHSIVEYRLMRGEANLNSLLSDGIAGYLFDTSRGAMRDGLNIGGTIFTLENIARDVIRRDLRDQQIPGGVVDDFAIPIQPFFDAAVKLLADFDFEPTHLNSPANKALVDRIVADFPRLQPEALEVTWGQPPMVIERTQQPG